MERTKRFLDTVFKQYKCYVTFSLILLNVGIFVFMFFQTGDMEFDLDYMQKMGAMNQSCDEDGQWYRLITAMFLHFDFMHLASNMVMLALVGSSIERVMGSGIFATVYLGGGLAGNLLSAYMNHVQGRDVVAAGASGAIFAISGALVLVFLMNQRNRENTSIQRIFAFVLLLLYQCRSNQNVDNYAHLGGLISGFVLAALLYTIKDRMRRH